MAWSTVATVVTGDIITAAWGNTYVRDNTDYLKTAIDDHIADAVGAHAATAIANTPAGAVVATTVQAAINEIDGDLTSHLNDATDAHAGTAITNTPAGNIAATTVQAALNELDGDKVAIPGSSAQGDILIRGAAGYERLAAGTDGYFLKTQGAGANPIWVALSKKAEIYLPMLHLSPSALLAASSTSYAAVTGSEITFTAGNWSSDVTFYFESLFYVAGAYTGTAQLWNDTDSASISEITTTSTSASGDLVRSTALTMPAGTKTLKLRYKLSMAGNVNAFFARIIAVMA